ncbi:MAG: class I SAM-dependent methyltransferase [Anaerolineales bacterium]|jgi:SAM-dependent methyltransferase
MTDDKLELLSVDLLDTHRPVMDELRVLARKMGLEFGWHYLLDLGWIISNLDLYRTERVIDAGAGVGMLQWYLASKGVDVISADRGSRAKLGLWFRANFAVEGLRPEDLDSKWRGAADTVREAKGVVGKTKAHLRNALSLARMLQPPLGSGRVFIYNQDLKTLRDVEDESIDAVVAVSALEHNTPEGLQEVVVELMRVLKVGGKLLATLGASPDKDWFHEASRGWNYTEASLRAIFDLEPGLKSNYKQYDQVYSALKECAELRDNLASFYEQSGDNGMPWGVWDPQYVIVGVCKVKK